MEAQSPVKAEIFFHKRKGARIFSAELRFLLKPVLEVEYMLAGDPHSPAGGQVMEESD
jgi:hypothetical protein